MHRQPVIITIIALLLAVSARLHADTSYILFQGPFGSGSTTETFKFTINYTHGALVTGQDLLNDIFGTPAVSGTYFDSTFGSQTELTAGNSTTGAKYLQFSFGDLLLDVILTGVEVDTNDNTGTGNSTLGWNYYVDGGSGSGGAYATTGSWQESNDGESTRLLTNGSFDGWVYGATGSDPNFNPVGTTATITGANNAPTVADFAAVPEPGSLSLLGLGAIPLALFIRRRARLA